MISTQISNIFKINFDKLPNTNELEKEGMFEQVKMIQKMLERKDKKEKSVNSARKVASPRTNINVNTKRKNEKLFRIIEDSYSENIVLSGRRHLIKERKASFLAFSKYSKVSFIFRKFFPFP